MKKAKYFLTVLAASMILTAGIGRAMAYFTTYAETEGSKQIKMGDETTITEEMEGWNKLLTIENKEGSEPVFIRARAYAGSQCTLSYSGDGWVDGGDGWWYYGTKIETITVPGAAGEANRTGHTGGTALTGKAPGNKANVLTVAIENIPKNPTEGDVFDVVVLYESTPVRYLADGTMYADWDVTMDYEDDRFWKEEEKGGAE